ncbi:hypothetical protein SOMG_04443 [Schizosaccharomyces osmophilus]|uniref:Uncharacterized protein n=1 Tax=Schizosaccharomyces osmophilus TaxID=2545709 RepID=A0AAE9WFU2_9SCHI|nr:uncharacterized protein SOMG_04443 [Schizosaccharomyces osmophilus]WBW75145.1 hypothetical protein SOMG_04443 [Schizosaccharomyces osmophilus]
MNTLIMSEDRFLGDSPTRLTKNECFCYFLLLSKYLGELIHRMANDMVIFESVRFRALLNYQAYSTFHFPARTKLINLTSV